MENESDVCELIYAGGIANLHMEREKKDNLMKKICYISFHPAPYRDPVIGVLNKKYDLTVLTMSEIPSTHTEWEKNACLPYPNVYLGRVWRIPKLGEYHTRIFKELRKQKWDLMIIPGHYPLTCMLALIYANIHHILYIYAADSAVFPEEEENLDVNFLVRCFVRKAKAVWVPGKAGARRMELLGKQKKDILLGSYVLDNKSLRNRYKDTPDHKKIRESLRIREKDFLFLFVGKLIPDRNIELMLKCFDKAFQKNCNIRLVVIGDGPDNEMVNEYELCEWLLHIERLPYEKLSDYYVASDAYVYTGREPYSLALAEAVIAGLPVVTTKTVGAAYDFVVDGHNGYLLDAREEIFVAHILKVADHVLETEKISEIADKCAEKFSAEKIGEQLIEYIEEI